MTVGLKNGWKGEQTMAINEIDILSEALDGNEELELQQERFRVDTLDKLDWAIRKWARVDQEAQQKVDCAKRQIERLQAYIKESEEKANREKAGLEAMMEPFVRQQLEGSKTKTFKAPSGNVAIRKQQPEINRDDEALLKFLQESKGNSFIKIVEKPDWSGLKKVVDTKVRQDGSVIFVTAEGELVKGVSGVVRPDKLVVEVG